MINANIIAIRPATGTWVVRAGGAVIAESSKVLELVEDGFSPVIFFPKSDIAMAFLEPSAQRSADPRKGDAQYYGIVTKSTLIENAAWAYDAPNELVAALVDHVAFHPGTVAVEQL